MIAVLAAMLSLISSFGGLAGDLVVGRCGQLRDFPSGSITPVYHSMPVLPESM